MSGDYHTRRFRERRRVDRTRNIPSSPIRDACDLMMLRSAGQEDPLPALLGDEFGIFEKPVPTSSKQNQVPYESSTESQDKVERPY